MKTRKIRTAAKDLAKKGLSESHKEHLAEVGTAFKSLYCEECKEKVQKIMEEKGMFKGSIYLSANGHKIICVKCKRKLRKRMEKKQ